MGIPISKWGFEVVSIPVSEWGSPFQNGDSDVPVSKWGSLFWNGDCSFHRCPFRNGDPHFKRGIIASPFWAAKLHFLGPNFWWVFGDAGAPSASVAWLKGWPKVLSPFWNGDSPFSYGKVAKNSETGSPRSKKESELKWGVTHIYDQRQQNSAGAHQKIPSLLRTKNGCRSPGYFFVECRKVSIPTWKKPFF